MLGAEDRRKGDARDREITQQRAELSAIEERLLGSYGWGDEESGLARIPIERAIELFLERGFQSRDTTVR